jgi:hypothetical protein
MKKSELQQIIREEVCKVLNEQIISEKEESELNEMYFTSEAVEMIKDMVMTGHVTTGAVVAVIYVIIYLTYGGLAVFILGIETYQELRKRFDKLIYDYKAKKQINPTQVKEFQKFVMDSIADLSPGRQKFITGLINKIKSTDIADKDTLLQLQRDVTRKLNRYKDLKK